MEDDLVTWGQSCGDLDRFTVVLFDGDGLQVYVAVAHDADLQALRAKDESARGNGELTALRCNLEVDEDIGSG